MILHVIAAIIYILQDDLSSTPDVTSSSPSLPNISRTSPSNALFKSESVLSCLLSKQTAQFFFYSTVNQSEEELTSGEDTDVTLPWKQASSEQASLPRLSPAHWFLISKDMSQVCPALMSSPKVQNIIERSLFCLLYPILIRQGLVIKMYCFLLALLSE